MRKPRRNRRSKPRPKILAARKAPRKALMCSKAGGAVNAALELWES